MSQPIFQHIYLPDKETYNILNVDRPYFIVPWHMHPEIEIMSIVKGQGTRFVGDSVESYKEGDLVIMGSNLPHCWKSGPSHYEEETKYHTKAHVILFNETSFGKDFFNLSELKGIRELFDRAGRGICFTGKTSKHISDKIEKAYLKKGVERFIAFIAILNDMANSTEYRLLVSTGYSTSLIESDMLRLNKVFDYLTINFSKQIRLDEVASLACMSSTAFCRYFKSHTNKSVIQFLNELRVGHAKKLLIETNENIGNIHFVCGFVNASNFYEQFRKITSCSPLEFRKRHRAKNIFLT
jgi:AraC-like DNA-binding protein